MIRRAYVVLAKVVEKPIVLFTIVHLQLLQEELWQLLSLTPLTCPLIIVTPTTKEICHHLQFGPTLQQPTLLVYV